MKVFSKGTLNTFDWFLIIGIILCSLIYALLSLPTAESGSLSPAGYATHIAKHFDFIGFIAGVTGVVCVVLTAKRSIANYIFGIVNVSLYAIISYKSQIYGDAALNALYYFPMQFIGWHQWVKNNGGKNREGNNDESFVKAKRMTQKERLFFFACCTIVVVSVGYILGRYTADPQPYKDSFTTVLSIAAMYLMVKAYMEQWMLWVMINTVSVIMWCMVFTRGDAHAGLMVIMWIFYLMNSINGLRIWLKASE